MKKRFLAFTLAEVLITLSIIGIVAAMTIPTLINNYQKKQYVTQLKKFYSNFQQGMKTVMMNNGCYDLSCTNLFNGTHNDNEWKENINREVKKAFAVIQDNDTVTQSPNWGLLYNKNSSSGQSGYYFLSQDGYFFGFVDEEASNCASNTCALIYVDINGKKPPNQWGRDAFRFSLSNSGTIVPFPGIPAWRQGSTSVCGTLGSSDITDVWGLGCSSRVIDEGWEMNY